MSRWSNSSPAMTPARRCGSFCTRAASLAIDTDHLRQRQNGPGPHVLEIHVGVVLGDQPDRYIGVLLDDGPERVSALYGVVFRRGDPMSGEEGLLQAAMILAPNLDELRGGDAGEI